MSSKEHSLAWVAGQLQYALREISETPEPPRPDKVLRKARRETDTIEQQREYEAAYWRGVAQSQARTVENLNRILHQTLRESGRAMDGELAQEPSDLGASEREVRECIPESPTNER